MSVKHIAASFAAFLAIPAAPAAASNVTIVALSADQLTKSADGDSVWSWRPSSFPSFVMPASGTVQFDFVFAGGSLNLEDFGGGVSAEQTARYNALAAQRAAQTGQIAVQQSAIAQLDAEIAARHAQRAPLSQQLQLIQADLTAVEADLQGIDQAKQAHQIELDGIDATLPALQQELDGLLNEIANILGPFGGAVELLFGAAKTAYEETQAQFNVVSQEISNLLARQNEVVSQVTQLSSQASVKQVAQGALNNAAAALGEQIADLDESIAALGAEKNEALMSLSRTNTLLSVTNQELSQITPSLNAERVEVAVTGQSGDNAPLFGQMILDVAGGDPLFASPFFQGAFADGKADLSTWADITASELRVAGFSLVFDLLGDPDGLISFDMIEVRLGADAISIVGGPIDAPLPAGGALFAGGLAAFAWMRRRATGTRL